MDLTIRTALRSDAVALTEFNQAMALETEGKQLDPTTLAHGVAEVFNDSAKGFYIVAEEGGDIVGGLMVTREWSDWRCGWFWWIQSVYVLPSHRGAGVYARMYEHVKNAAKGAGDVCGFRLYVEKENVQAQKVYEKNGMEKTYYLMYEELAN
jgi:GNAT superfamily N-acetyltransferase